MSTKSQTHSSDGVVSTGRVFAASPVQIFRAFEQPGKLAEWWGPAGFSNTFEHFDFTPGGRWVYMMHGPDGHNYHNESVFSEIEPYTRIVIQHVAKPIYTLTVTLTERDNGSYLTWVQKFENEVFAEKMRDFLENANNENLDRLEALLSESHG